MAVQPFLTCQKIMAYNTYKSNIMQGEKVMLEVIAVEE